MMKVKAMTALAVAVLGLTGCSQALGSTPASPSIEPTEAPPTETPALEPTAAFLPTQPLEPDPIPTEENYSEDSGPYRISYTSSYEEGDSFLNTSFLINPDGTGQEMLNEGGAFITWAPDGSKYAYSIFDGSMKMLVYYLASGESVEIGEGFVTDWTPDSSRIMYMGGPGFNSMDIYLCNEDGTDIVQLTDSSWSDTFGKISPDGTKIAFHSDRDGQHDIYLMDFDGSNQQQLTDDNSPDQSPDWSPDGSRLVFSSGRAGAEHIFTMNADGSDVRQITDGGVNDWHPVWSPDGGLIAFTSYRHHSTGDADIYVVSVEGGDVERVTDSPHHDENANWVPVVLP